MTTASDIGTLVGGWAEEKAEASRHYARAKELEFEIIAYMRETYPDEWQRMEQGAVTTFTAEGVSFSRKREYDINKLRAMIGEEYPQAIYEVVAERVDGNVVKGLWKDAAIAKQLVTAVLPAVPSMKVK